MTSPKLSNISLADYRKCLIKMGCKCYRTSGGHEHYNRNDLTRPITLQTHIDPVPEFIVKQHLRAFNITRSDFWIIYKSI